MRIGQVSARRRVQEALFEDDQRSVGTGEVAPLVHLPGPDPQPCAWLEVVAGEVDGVPEPALPQGEKVMEVGALGPGEAGPHAVRRPPAQVCEGHHLQARGQADRGGETDVSYLGDVSHFDHLLSPAYPGVTDATA